MPPPKYQALCSCVDPKTGERKPANTYVYFDGYTRLVCASHPLPADCQSPAQRRKAAQRELDRKRQ